MRELFCCLRIHIVYTRTFCQETNLNFFTAHHANWPDARLGPFAPKDPQFPLPGNVGIDLTQLPQPTKRECGTQRQTIAEALLELESDDIRKAVVIDTYSKDFAENHEEAVATEVTNPITCLCN